MTACETRADARGLRSRVRLMAIIAVGLALPMGAGAQVKTNAPPPVAGAKPTTIERINELLTDRVFAGLATVVMIGWLVERFVFDTVERLTVRRWGVQR